jgi:hypothetical protein
MRRPWHPLVRLLPIIALTVVAACSSGSSSLKLDQQEQDCSAITAAARQVVLVNPNSVAPDELTRNTAAAAALEAAASAATTEVAAPAQALAASAKAYAEALARRDVERATANEGLLRQQAVPVAEACGMGKRADLVLGTTSGTEGQG